MPDTVSDASANSSSISTGAGGGMTPALPGVADGLGISAFSIISSGIPRPPAMDRLRSRRSWVGSYAEM